MYREIKPEDLAKLNELTAQKLREYYIQYSLLRRQEAIQKARSFREYVKHYLHYSTLDLLGSLEGRSYLITTYVGFVFKTMRDIFEYCVNRLKWDKPEHIQQRIDLIFDYYEKVYAEPRKLDPNIISKLELLILNTFQNLDTLRSEYQTLKQPKPPT